MKVEKFIEENDLRFWNICDSAVRMILPLKKSYGYSIDKCISDEKEFIHDDLLIPLIENSFEDNIFPNWMESGWYRIMIDKHEKEISIDILFCLEEGIFEVT